MSALDGMTPASFAARRLGISSRTVRRMITAGQLRGAMISGSWHVAEAEVAFMVRERRAMAARLAGLDPGQAGHAPCPHCRGSGRV